MSAGSNSGSETDGAVELFLSLIGKGDFDEQARRVISATYDALANGEPVAIDDVAHRIGSDAESVEQTIDRCNVHYDGGRIVGFGGLSLAETAHSFHVRGRRLYTWCTWDPLFIAPILGEEAYVESTCPITGQRVSLTVGPDGVRHVQPTTAVMSMRVPDDSCAADTIANFCSVVLLFATRDAALKWTHGRDDAFVVDVDQAFDLGRVMVRERAIEHQP